MDDKLSQANVPFPVVRTDAGARVLVERVDKLRSEVLLLNSRLKNEILLILGAASVVIVLACWVVANMGGARGEKAGATALAEVRLVKQAAQAHEESDARRFDNFEKQAQIGHEDSQAIYQFLLTRERQPRLEAPP